MNETESNVVYLKKLAFKWAMVLVIIGGLNWLLVGTLDIDLVRTLFGKSFLATIIYVLVGISAIAIMFDRDTYLPFLGPMVAPCSTLVDRTPPGATTVVRVSVEPRAKILYWAAEQSTEELKTVKTWNQAYADYENAGVSTADADGVAILKVRPPQQYSVPWKGVLAPHVHYRVCGPNGFMGRIQTAFITEAKVEAFEGF